MLILLVNLTGNSYAQDLKPRQEKKLVKKGRKEFRDANYWQAKSYYDQVIDANSTNSEYWYETGIVYFESNVNSEKAIEYFEKSLELTKKDTINETYLYLGHCYHYVGEFEKSIEYYNNFRQFIEDSDRGLALRSMIDRQVEICNNAIAIRDDKNTPYSKITNMGEVVNSTSADYAPVVSNSEDFLLYCSRRPPGKKRSNIDGQFFEDIYFTTNSGDKWNESKMIDKSSGFIADEINEGKTHEAPISMSADGKTLYIFKENSVWKSNLNDQKQWTIPERMNQDINIGEFNPSIFITPDGSEMFIVAVGAEGSLGGRDIYHSLLQEDGTWETPNNIGPSINTEYDEDAPFITKDGKTLYFASNGHNTSGGYDIYKSEKQEDGTWSNPMNVGAPINSPGNDIYYVENDEGTIAYFASQRPGSYGYLDIYTASMECVNIPTTNIKGYAVYASTHQPIEGVIKITDKESGEEMGTYVIDSKKGTYNMVLPPNKTYQLDLIVANSKYNEVRPHTEEFHVPKQCDAYNLFQQININHLYDSTGNEYAQKATFRNAMFDIESEIKSEFKTNTKINNTFADSSNSIKGSLAYNNIIKASNVTVTLLNQNNEIIRITETDDNGEFAFEHIDVKSNYSFMINEDDAKRNYYGDNTTNNNANIKIEGTIEKVINNKSATFANTNIYLANTNRIVTNKTTTSATGTFNMSNESVNESELTTLNENTNFTYNFNIPTEEVLFSAYIVNIDPNNTDLNYTEVIDIIELKNVDPVESPEFANIYFDFDKYFLRVKSKNILDNLFNYMNENPSVSIRLDGHTDWFGTDAYNVKLSENRALSAHKFLIDKGISPDRINNEWFGESKPAVANANADGTDNPDNRQLNRRVERKVDIPDMAAIYIQL
jgi:outer membrane protein OmpA-like peptidoglycan-associated protein